MAFQDFDQISERRRAVREQRFRRRVIIGVVSGFALLVLVGAGVFAVVSRAGHRQNGPANSTAATASAPTTAKDVSKTDKLVKVICNATDYKDKCENTLTLALRNHSSSSHHPRDYVEMAILEARDELRRAVNKTDSLKFDTPKEKAAYEDCKVLMEDAMEELEASASAVSGNSTDSGSLSSKTPQLNSWLSAVMSYQQTCVDGFPEGKLKTDMEKLFKASKEFTSNSLALISEVASFLTAFQATGTARHLLAKEPNSSPVSLDSDGFPNWIAHEDRRMLKGKSDKPTPNVTVAKDGTGDFKTISGALAAIPAKYDGRYIIYIKEGVYEETVIVTKKMVNVTIYGDGSQKSIITGSKNFVDGVRTFQTATFVALGEGFFGKALGFRNTAGPEKHQAVAVRVQADRAIFANCRFEGYQDTLYTQTHRQFYRSCVISGTIDFIFGDAAVVFQNCMLVVRKPLQNQQNIVTAQGRVDKQQTTGIVLHNCRIMADKTLEPEKTRVRSYLGRPWKEYSRTIVMESNIEDLIHPDGWLSWEGEFALKTLFYAEYNNKGPGAKVDARVNWPGYKVLNKEEANKFTVENFLQGSDWLNVKGVPVRFTLYN
ncbi:Pectinesterase inhibitor domain containing protein [Parasponia andersonii]|uniref:Pectinesterase n=1 Tax=Parasponia andersonii TaxID=3476 RepID=A0A2P5BKS8_PARAD|nr:Pectinesterase inhibitor domain containing protein [Parasponia andersonii]